MSGSPSRSIKLKHGWSGSRSGKTTDARLPTSMRTSVVAKSVVLLSGGLDSSANLALCREKDHPVLALTVRYGQRAQDREVQAARALSQFYDVKHEVVDIPWLGSWGGSAL